MTAHAVPRNAPSLLTPAGLQRRLKRRLKKEPQRFLAICAPGLEPFLLRETVLLPSITDPVAITGGVEFCGPLDSVYAANLQLRTATRVIMRIASFTAKSLPELYNKTRRIDWEVYTGFAKQIDFDVTAKRSRLLGEAGIAQTVYEGIVSVLTPLGTVPKRSETAALRVHIRMFEDECTVSIDSTGEVLHKRGYREATAKAPIRENIAAALLMAAGWERYPVIADPLCGAGTFMIEAAMLARDIAPGSMRRFAFEEWPSFHPGKWERLRSSAAARSRVDTPVRLVAGDRDAGAIRAARENARRAGVDRDICFVQADCREFNRDGSLGRYGLIITNPPYGKRIGDRASVERLFRDLGSTIRTACAGWHFGMVTGDPSLIKAAGLRAENALRFSNGGIDVAFVMGRI